MGFSSSFGFFSGLNPKKSFDFVILFWLIFVVKLFLAHFRGQAIFGSFSMQYKAGAIFEFQL